MVEHQLVIQAVLLSCLYFFVQLPYYFLESLYYLIFPPPPKSVKGEIVLITGTGHGMGRLLALKYAREGATVVGWDVNEELNKKTFKEINELGLKKAYAYTCDVSNREQILSLAKKVQKEVGDVTILINNAGIMPSHSFFEHTENEIRKIMDINIMAHFWLLQAFLPKMKENNHGHIVALSSMAGVVGCVNLVPYCASKFAVRGLMAALYDEFRRDSNNQIHFTTVCPVMVNTGLCKNYEITYDFLTPMLKAEEVVEEIFKAQTNNVREILLPKHITPFLKLSEFCFPQRAKDLSRNILKTDLKSDLEITANGESKLH